MQRVLAHLTPFFFRQRRGLAQYGVRHPDLADVVEERAEFERARLLAAEAEFAPEPEAEADDPLRVSVRLGVARFERGCERLERGAVGVFERTEGAVQLRRALRDHLFEVGLVAALGGAQVVVFERAADRRLDVLEVERLHHVVERARAQRLDGALDGLHAADHDDDGVGRDAEQVRDHLQPAHAAHLDVADDEVVFALAQARQPLLRRAYGRALVAPAQEV